MLFRSVPHYAYLKMKMPGPKGIITVSGDFKRSIDCAKHSSELVQALVIVQELEEIKRKVDFAKQNLECRKKVIRDHLLAGQGHKEDPAGRSSPRPRRCDRRGPGPEIGKRAHPVPP